MSWGPIFKTILGKKDGKTIKHTDNNAVNYIKDSLRIMRVSTSNLKKKGIQHRHWKERFIEHGAEVTHLDIGAKVVKELNRWAKKIKKIKSINGDIAKTKIGENKYDIIFLAEFINILRYLLLHL